MDKKASPKYILLILVILLIIDFFTTSFGIGTWNLNRSIGWQNDDYLPSSWGNEFSDFNFSILNSIFAITTFILIYTFLLVRKKSVNLVLVCLQLLLVIGDIILQIIYFNNPFPILIIINWFLMIMIIISTYRNSRLSK